MRARNRSGYDLGVGHEARTEVYMLKQIINDGIPAILFMALFILAVSLIESL